MPDAQHMRGVEARRCQQLGVLPQRKRTTRSAEHRMPFLLILSPRQIGMHAKKERLHLQVLFCLYDTKRIFLKSTSKIRTIHF